MKNYAKKWQSSIACFLIVSSLLFSGCSSQNSGVSSSSSKPSTSSTASTKDLKTVGQVQSERDNIVASNSFQVDLSLNENEKILDKKLKNMIAEYEASTTDFEYAPGNPFYNFENGKDKYISSTDIYKLLAQMPKGSNLHTHATATMVADRLYNIAMASDDFYIYCAPDSDKYLEGQIFVSEKKEDVPEGFVLFIDAINSGAITKERVVSLWSIDKADEDIEHAWDEFGRCFVRIEAASKNIDYYYKEFYKQAFLECIEDNISHLELRSGLVKFNGDTTGIEGIKILRDAYYEVKQQHPNFTLKLILTYSKVKSKTLESVETFLTNAYNVQQTIKDEFDPNHVVDFIVGFDLVNEEDAGYSLQEYTPYILEMREKGMGMDPYFHAGESNEPTSDGIIDAYLLGTKRIGHGLNLYKFPDLLEKVKEADIALEVCPISNQLLRYVSDLRCHPAYEYLKRGVPIVICSDDPALLGNAGLSYDFFEVAVAWNLGLKEIKQLCMNSITYSACTDKEKESMMSKWQSDWDQFVKNNI